MKKIKNIIDSWNMIEKYNLCGWIQVDDRTILIPDAEFERLLASAKNKKYILNLVKK